MHHNNDYDIVLQKAIDLNYKHVELMCLKAINSGHHNVLIYLVDKIKQGKIDLLSNLETILYNVNSK